MPARPLSAERAARVREMHAAGRSVAEIGAEYGVAETTAREWHKQLGLTPNRPPPWQGAFWTRERLDLARKLVAEQGVTTATARALGCSIQRVQNKADAEGWPRRPLRGPSASRTADRAGAD